LRMKPARLREGECVRIVAPASPVRPELLEKGVACLKGLGFRVEVGDVFRTWRYLAGSDRHRRSELTQALEDPSVRAIFFARGGYGSGRLLLPVLPAPNRPKILLGCSDITSLHTYFQHALGWTVFHGPMPSGDFARGAVHVDSLLQAITQTEPYALAPESVQVLSAGPPAEGILRGGCLTLLEASIGSPWEPDWNDSILFLEDTATKPYQIDRMITHLMTIGKLDHVRAFIFGEMKDCVQVENQGYTLQEVLLDLLDNLGKPVCFGFPSGHVGGLNWTLPLGVRARLLTEPTFRLEILEGAVS
jgi:muramoyltetrapeptide carboxypeptidase